MIYIWLLNVVIEDDDDVDEDDDAPAIKEIIKYIFVRLLHKFVPELL